jgi:hypothetical protein
MGSHSSFQKAPRRSYVGLRLEDKTKVLWIDAICINQSVRARVADGHLGIDKGLAGVCPAISVATAI